MLRYRLGGRIAFKIDVEVFPDNYGEREPWTLQQVRRKVKT